MLIGYSFCAREQIEALKVAAAREGRSEPLYHGSETSSSSGTLTRSEEFNNTLNNGGSYSSFPLKGANPCGSMEPYQNIDGSPGPSRYALRLGPATCSAAVYAAVQIPYLNYRRWHVGFHRLVEPLLCTVKLLTTLCSQ